MNASTSSSVGVTSTVSAVDACGAVNALATIAVATELELPDAPIVSALAKFSGVGRRFQRYGEVGLPAAGAFTLIDTLPYEEGLTPVNGVMVPVVTPLKYTDSALLYGDQYSYYVTSTVTLISPTRDGPNDPW